MISCPYAIAGLLLLAGQLTAQTAQGTAQAGTEQVAATQSAVAQPLPDINALMRQVETNERKSEEIQKNYLYRQKNTLDKRDSHEAIKESETREAEIFWLNGVEVRRLLRKDGKDLTADEAKKQNEKIDEQVKKAQERREKADAHGKETDSRGHDEITFARVLELGSFSNERREWLNDRPTIVIDYTGDPKAKTHNTAEGVFKELSGTVWVDEQDKTLVRTEGRFRNDFRMAGGLVVDVKKGTWFKASFVKINGEVWLPQQIEADGHARYLLFFSLNGHFLGRSEGYRKFKATSTILPGVDKVEPEPGTWAPKPTPSR